MDGETRPIQGRKLELCYLFVFYSPFVPDLGLLAGSAQNKCWTSTRTMTVRQLRIRR
jgi:hypothetical protein